MRRLGRRTMLVTGAVLLVAAGAGGCAESLSSTAGPGGSSSAGPSRSPSLGPGGVDFGQDQEANGAASDAGMRLLRDLPKFTGYAGLRIVSYGFEVSNVGEPSAEMRAVAARDAGRYRGQQIPVRFRSVRHTERELQAVKDRLVADSRELARQGIETSTWGIDLATNTVEISLTHYTDGYRDTLLARYGDRVTVTPHDVVIQGS